MACSRGPFAGGDQVGRRDAYATAKQDHDGEVLGYRSRRGGVTSFGAYLRRDVLMLLEVLLEHRELLERDGLLCDRRQAAPLPPGTLAVVHRAQLVEARGLLLRPARVTRRAWREQRCAGHAEKLLPTKR